MKTNLLIAEFLSTPWALMPERLNAVAGVAVPVLVIWLGMVAIVGAPTVTLKVVAELLTLSLTLTVIVADPCWPAAGVMVTLRLVPPASLVRTMFGLPLGIRVVLSEVAVTASSLAGVSGSTTVNAIGPVLPPRGIAWFGMEEIAGDWLAPATSAKRVPTLKSSISIVPPEVAWRKL